MIQRAHDGNFYFIISHNLYVLLLLYINNLYLTKNDLHHKLALRQALKQEFEMNDSAGPKNTWV